MNAIEHALLTDDFPSVSYDEWRKAAEALLKGAPFEKVMHATTPEGITPQPIYRLEDVLDRAAADEMPGAGGFARGTKAEGNLDTPWEVAQELEESDPAIFNKTLVTDLGRGQTALNAILNVSEEADHPGLRLHALADLSKALQGVYPEAISFHFQSELSGLSVEAAFLAWLASQEANVVLMRGSLNMDPVGVLATQGALPVSLSQVLDELSTLVGYNDAHLPEFRAVGVSGFPYHNAGASAVEELAASLATGVYYLRELSRRGCSVDSAARQIRFTLPVGGDFFMELAKFRVARQLWARIVSALGGSRSASAMQIHARTGSFNKTRHDPYVNMLRVTTEALSAVLGGVDSLCVGTFDESLRPPTAFSRRIARNTQLILQEECDLRSVVDPAGGCWYVESMAAELAGRVWSAFQTIEKEGGIVASLQKGSIQAAIAPKLRSRRSRLGQRRDTLVGTNKYPNINETALEKPCDKSCIQTSDKSVDGDIDPIALGAATLPQLVELLQGGASLDSVTNALRSGAGEGERCQALPATRLAADYEALRETCETHRAKTGARPALFLANLGALRRHKARADFTRAFFEVGGFEIVSSPGFDSAQGAAQGVADSGAPIAVICGHDEDYADRLVETLQAIRSRCPEVKLVLAGFPGENEAAYRAAGLDDYIFVKSDNYAVNRSYLEEIGVL